MSDFKWLEDIVAARTPGNWEQLCSFQCDEDPRAENFSNHWRCIGPSVVGLPQAYKDSVFTAVMGTVGDLLMDVVRAAALLDEAEGTEAFAEAEWAIHYALEALKQAGPKT